MKKSFFTKEINEKDLIKHLNIFKVYKSIFNIIIYQNKNNKNEFYFYFFEMGFKNYQLNKYIVKYNYEKTTIKQDYTNYMFEKVLDFEIYDLNIRNTIFENFKKRIIIKNNYKKITISNFNKFIKRFNKIKKDIHEQIKINQKSLNKIDIKLTFQEKILYMYKDIRKVGILRKNSNIIKNYLNKLKSKYKIDIETEVIEIMNEKSNIKIINFINSTYLIINMFNNSTNNNIDTHLLEIKNKKSLFSVISSLSILKKEEYNKNLNFNHYLNIFFKDYLLNHTTKEFKDLYNVNIGVSYEYNHMMKIYFIIKMKNYEDSELHLIYNITFLNNEIILINSNINELHFLQFLKKLNIKFQDDYLLNLKYERILLNFYNTMKIIQIKENDNNFSNFTSLKQMFGWLKIHNINIFN